MSQGIVNFFKSIQIQEHQGAVLILPFCDSNILTNTVLQQPSVWQTCQYIVVGLMPQVFLISLALGDINRITDHAYRLIVFIIQD